MKRRSSNDRLVLKKNFYLYMTSGAMVFALIVVIHVAIALAEEKTSVSGLTEPVKDVTLSLEVGGRIDRILFKEGEHIQKDKVILELNKKSEELEVKRRKLIWESKAEVTSAAERVKTLKSLFESTQALFKTMGSISKEELDTKEMDLMLAEAEHERLTMGEERERIEYEMALENVEKLILKSPLQGIVTELFLEEGENCEPHQPLVHVVDTSKCRLVCNIEAPLGEKLKKGQAVDLQIPVGSNMIQKKGTVIFISPVVDSASGLLLVKIEFENPDGTVRPGVAGTMMIPSK